MVCLQNVKMFSQIIAQARPPKLKLKKPQRFAVKAVGITHRLRPQTHVLPDLGLVDVQKAQQCSPKRMNHSGGSKPVVLVLRREAPALLAEVAFGALVWQRKG